MDSDSVNPEADRATSSGRARQALPPIRTLLGPELELTLPPLPSSHSSHSASSWGSTRPFWGDDARGSSSSGSRSSGSAHRAQTRARSSTVSSQRLSPRPATHSHSHSHSPSLPSTHSHSHSPSFHSTHSLPPSPPSPLVSPSPPRLVPPAAPYPPLPSSAPHSSCSVLRPDASGRLITTPTLPRRQRPPKTLEQPAPGPSTQAEDDVGARRHICPICLKRFNRPSSLRVHESVHTGSRPFACPHPGCNKAFSVASNMRRHHRTHGYSASEPEPGPEPEADSEGEDEPSAEGSSGYYEWATGDMDYST